MREGEGESEKRDERHTQRHREREGGERPTKERDRRVLREGWKKKEEKPRAQTASK